MRAYSRKTSARLASCEIECFSSSDFTIFGARLPDSCFDLVCAVRSWVGRGYEHVVIELTNCRTVSIIRALDSTTKTLELWELWGFRQEPRVGLTAEEAVRITRELALRPEEGDLW